MGAFYEGMVSRVPAGIELPEPLRLVPAPAEMGDTDTTDAWCLWVNAHSGLS